MYDVAENGFFYVCDGTKFVRGTPAGKYFSKFSIALGLRLESMIDKERSLGKKLITLVMLSPKVKLN